MHVLRSKSLTLVAAMSLAAQPVMAVGHGLANGTAPRTFAAAATAPVPHAGTTRFGLAAMSVTLVPISALPASTMESQRGAIGEIMIALGEDEHRARHLATQLTAEDLAVLLANPKMMQKAGDALLIIGALIVVGVVVALVLAADSSTVIVSV